MQAQELKVYWRPGCSSCVKVKEFLSSLGVAYESINVSATPEAMDDLRALGVRTVPVVRRGQDYVFAQALEDVSRFIGRDVQLDRLPPDVLMKKWSTVLHAAQRHIMQLSADRLPERATAGRDRSIRDLAYHIFQIGEAFLAVMQDGVEDWAPIANAAPPEGVTTVAQIREYGSDVTARIEAWWKAFDDKSCQRPVKLYYGTHLLHQFLERSTWHSAQHARQIGAVLEKFGIRPDVPLTTEDYAGLPMPEGLWE